MEEFNRRIIQSLMEIQRHESRTSGMFCHEAGALDNNKEGGPESLRGGGILSYFSVGCWSKGNIVGGQLAIVMERGQGLHEFLFPCCYGKIPRQRQLKRERVYLDLQFQGHAAHQ